MAAVLASITTGIAWQAGLVKPRLDGYMSSVTVGSGELWAELMVINRNGRAPVRVIDAGQAGPGLELVDVQLSTRTLAPDEGMIVTLVYEITDCAAVSDQPWPVPVRVQRWWGAQTVPVHLDTRSVDPEFDEWAPGGQPSELEWQRYYASWSCAQ